MYQRHADYKREMGLGCHEYYSEMKRADIPIRTRLKRFIPDVDIEDVVRMPILGKNAAYIDKENTR